MLNRKLTIAATSFLVLVLTSGPAAAERLRADKSVGVGVMLGTPTGLSGKFFIGGTAAIQLGLGVSSDGRYHPVYDDHSGTQFQLDIVWHPAVVARTNAVTVPLYIGVGGQASRHRYYHGDHMHRHNDVGARIPLGIAFDFNRVPLDVFLELVPVVEVIHDDDEMYYHDDIYLTGAAGMRYYF